MPESDITAILLAHDHWATRAILDACAPLTAAQFHQRFEMGPGSLHDTLRHTLYAMGAWCDVLHARPFRNRDPEKQYTVPEMLQILDAVSAELIDVSTLHPPHEIVSRTRDSVTTKYTRAAVLAHVTTHSVHHRAQCLNMLRHLGVDPLPMISVTTWTLAVDPVIT
jgi:uncharacterized damage-inducible protein DinB